MNILLPFNNVRALAVLRPYMHCAQPSTDRWRVSIFSGYEHFLPFLLKLLNGPTSLATRISTKTTSDLQGCYLGGLLTWRAHALEGSLGAYISDLSFPATRRIYIHNDAYIYLPIALTHIYTHRHVYLPTCCIAAFSLYRYLYMIFPILIYK